MFFLNVRSLFLHIEAATFHGRSSEIPQNNIFKGQDKILAINKILKSSQYINPIGGTELYCRDTFEKNDMKLNFIKTLDIDYKQFMGFYS